jgi:hypothetical protein
MIATRRWEQQKASPVAQRGLDFNTMLALRQNVKRATNWPDLGFGPMPLTAAPPLTTFTHP